MRPLPAHDLEEILVRFLPDCLNLRNKKVLIMGGTGFLGSWITEALCYINQENSLDMYIEVFARNPNKLAHLQNAGVKLTEKNFEIGSITSKGESYDLIFHAMTPTVENSLSPILRITNKLLSEIETWDSPPRFVHLSSGSVYITKNASLMAIPEQRVEYSPQLSDYGKLKLSIEDGLEMATKRGFVNGVSPRLFAFTGPRLPLDAHFAIGNFVLQGLKRETIQVKGNSKTVRSYMHPVDAIVWLLKCAVSKHSNIFHIGSEIGYQMNDIAKKVANIFGVSVEHVGEEKPFSHYVPLTSQTRKLLNVNQEIGLEDAIIRWRKWESTQ